MLPVCCMEDQIKLAFCAQHQRKGKKKLIILFITILMCFTITKRSNSESSSGKFLHRSTRTLLTEERPTGDIIFSIIRVVSNLWLQIIPSLVRSDHRKFVDTLGRPLYTDWKKHVSKVSNPFKILIRLRQHVVCDFHWITLFRTDQIEKYAGCKENWSSPSEVTFSCVAKVSPGKTQLKIVILC